MTTNEFKCVCCKTTLPIGDMSEDPRCHGWCVDCDDHEKEAAERDEGNYESDDYGYEDDYEDPAVTYERERGEAFQDRVDMWRNEY